MISHEAGKVLSMVVKPVLVTSVVGTLVGLLEVLVWECLVAMAAAIYPSHVWE